MTDHTVVPATGPGEPYEGTVKAIRADPYRFFDGGDDQSAPETGRQAVYEFIREVSGRTERFRLRRRIGYRARLAGGDREVDLVIPRDLARWHTDFASVPAAFAWLVPRSGDHLPAALIHDALLEGQAVDPNHTLSRDAADDVMRQAMADLGTGVVRRWVVWTAVSLPTLLFARVGLRRERSAIYYAVVGWGTLAAIVACGAVATIDLLDECVPWLRGAGELPWMTGGSFVEDLWRGAAGAVFVPAMLSGLWGRFWRAGIIAGVGLALLVHVTIAIGALTVVYLLLEGLGRYERGRLLLGVLIVAVAASGVLFLAAL
jgi:hypothetical protein